MRPPLVLVVEGAVAVAVTVALDGMPKEPLVLTDVPAFLPPASCPLGDDTGELLLIVSGWLSGAPGSPWRAHGEKVVNSLTTFFLAGLVVGNRLAQFCAKRRSRGCWKTLPTGSGGRGGGGGACRSTFVTFDKGRRVPSRLGSGHRESCQI